MDKLNSKRVNFHAVDETTDVPEFENLFSYEIEENLFQQSSQQLQAEESYSDIVDLILKHYGHRLCLKPETETETQMSDHFLQTTVNEISADESYSDLVDLVLKVYGNQPPNRTNLEPVSLHKRRNQITSERGTTTDPIAVAKASKLTQTTRFEQVEIYTNTRDVETPLGFLKGVCFRFFFGPSLDETGVSFGENFPMIRQFFITLKSKIFTDRPADEDDGSLAAQSSRITFSFTM